MASLAAACLAAAVTTAAATARATKLTLDQQTPPRPTFSESFSARTIEIDDTLNGTVSVQQVLHRDAVAHRQWMFANGSLVGGGEEQIMRCDIHPMGWTIMAGGADAANVSSWQCDNHTIASDPQHCQWGLFWTPLPTNATYKGKDTMDGKLCDLWQYWSTGEKYALWALNDAPVATGKIWTFHPGYHLWHIIWRDFVSVRPPASKFEPSKGLKCPQAKPPPPSSPVVA